MIKMIRLCVAISKVCDRAAVAADIRACQDKVFPRARVGIFLQQDIGRKQECMEIYSTMNPKFLV